MTKPKTKSQKIIKILLIILGVIAGLALLLVGFIYLWPLQTKSLQTAQAQTLSFEQATAKVASLREQEKASGVRPECLTTAYTQNSKAAKSIVMFHGTGACPQQFDALGRYFFERGYNVLVARSPHYGMADNKEHGKATAQELTAFASQSVDIAAGLGEEVGVTGLSGGAVLATWASEYRTDQVERLLAISPFYSPSTTEVPAWQHRILAVGFGYGIIPDQFSEPWGLSYHALGQYLRITANLKDQPVNKNLKSVDSVISYGDTAIDRQLAESVPAKIAATNQLSYYPSYPPAEWNLGHDIVGTVNNKDISNRQNDLYPLYLQLYESN